MESPDLKELINYTEINGDNIVDILVSKDDNEINEYLSLWKERISEEMQTRIETGFITPIKCLTWCVRGKGWESLSNKEVPF